jgi:uncharacterized protein (DUF2126 family)
MTDDYSATRESGIPDADFWSAVAAHDAAVARVGLAIWIGAEPTFTLRQSEAAEWLFEAMGPEKLERAVELVRELRHQHPGHALLRTLGRQYAEEAQPRWSFGLYGSRHGGPVWRGPPDPLETPVPASPLEAGRLERFWRLLGDAGIRAGWSVRRFSVAADGSLRLLCRTDGKPVDLDPGLDIRLVREAVHQLPTPQAGPYDDLAAKGYSLLSLRVETGPAGGDVASIEMPAFATVRDFLDCLDLVGASAREAGVPALVVRGYPPPVDRTVSWTTITPDPAVVEVNLAPEADTAGFVRQATALYELAARVHLCPYRLQYTGGVSDSGGGGQFTLGGPAPLASPFLQQPMLLPRWVRYLNHHPALSYLFATDYVGGASQSPRTDEGTRASFEELDLALASLAATPDVQPWTLWATLAPFLADPAGNSHRSELNIEKLWNPYLPGRGCLGLVEFRAFRMPRTPRRAGAIAALLRASTAMLARHDPAPDLMHWERELHDRFALPFFLRQDLRGILDELERSGLGLGDTLEQELLRDAHWPAWSARLGSIELVVERAVEFWPLIGDVASQERGGSREVDSSTARLQVLLRTTDGSDLDPGDYALAVAGCRLPLQPAQDGPVRSAIAAFRYREFQPLRGLHPCVKPVAPLEFHLGSPRTGEGLRAVLHPWRPDGGAYDGLPKDLAEAQSRRAARWQVTHLPASALPDFIEAPLAARAGYTVDLRWLQAS